ncbi:hypothetical protein [Pelagibius litoralis]|uniref:hypothetical protein n=1 Tax=Pelagibius litoralis TaxID=374515 RepID=UPI0019803C0E|nr:hypothetical protein [Pelagibius litoralis]
MNGTIKKGCPEVRGPKVLGNEGDHKMNQVRLVLASVLLGCLAWTAPAAAQDSSLI